MAADIGLCLIGLPNAFLWGILAATLRFVSYIGPWVAAPAAIGLAMAISTGLPAPPLTIFFLVIGNHVPQLPFLDILLGNEPVQT